MSTEQKLLDEYFEELELQGKLTLKQFTEYFPSNHRRYSQVDTLYRQYLQWRQDMIAAIKSNIAGECNRNGLENAAVIHPLSMGYIKGMKRQTRAEAIQTLNEAKQEIVELQEQLEMQCRDYLQDITVMGDLIESKVNNTVPLNKLNLEPLNQLSGLQHRPV